jgi:predicted Zn finger-like uncharacterized protein
MKTQCPNCKAKFNINETSVGKQAKCPKCAKGFTIAPFVETPAAVETPAKNSEPAATPVKDVTRPEAATKIPSTKSEIPNKFQVPKIQNELEAPVKSPEPMKEEKSESKALPKTALSKTVFVYCWIAVRIIAGVLGSLGLMLAIRKGTHSTLIVTFAAADVFLLCSVAIELMLFYKMWAAIQDGQASISPAKAVGFLFIPVFNIYWALCMLTGFVEDYNAFKQRRSVKAKDLPFVLFLIYAFMFISAAMAVTTPMICVFAFLRLISRAFISYSIFSWSLLAFALAAGIGHFITYMLVATKTCNAINALSDFAPSFAKASEDSRPERKGR